MKLILDLEDGSTPITIADHSDLVEAGRDGFLDLVVGGIVVESGLRPSSGPLVNDVLQIVEQVREDRGDDDSPLVREVFNREGRDIEDAEPVHIAQVLDGLPIVRAARLLENI